MRRPATWMVLAVTACGGFSPPVSEPVVVVLPSAADEPPATSTSLMPVVSGPPLPSCPAGTLLERGDRVDRAGLAGSLVCVRVLPSPEIPAWEPPSGHLDPCATWTSDGGLVDCDPSNESPRDAGPDGAPRVPRGQLPR
jgi:hypothetical protein